MLLRENQYDLKLSKPTAKVLRVCPMMDHTFVMVTVADQGLDDEKLVHVDKKGNTLWERGYKDSLDTFGLFNQRQVIVLSVAKGQIEIIDLGTYSIRTYPHSFCFPETASMRIHTFYETRYLCVEESGLIGDGTLKLSYYLYTSHSFELVSEYRSRQGEWAYGNSITKANNHSKIAWWKEHFTDEIQFKFWDLSQNALGTLSTVKCGNTLPNMLVLQNVTLSIGELWESKPDTYTMACMTSASRQSYNEFYVVDAISRILRKAKFKLNLKFRGGFIHFFNLGNYCVIHGANFKEGSSLEAPVFYIDNKNESVMVTQSWKASTHSHFYIPGYDPNSIVESVHANGEASQVTVLSKRLMTVSEMYLHFLLHLNEDFDDDLLQDALDTLDCINIG